MLQCQYLQYIKSAIAKLMPTSCITDLAFLLYLPFIYKHIYSLIQFIFIDLIVLLKLLSDLVSDIFTLNFSFPFMLALHIIP